MNLLLIIRLRFHQSASDPRFFKYVNLSKMKILKGSMCEECDKYSVTSDR